MCVRYLPAAMLGVIGFSVTAFVVLTGVAVVAATRWKPLAGAVRSPAAVRIGQVALLALAAICVPSALSSIADIVNRPT